MNRKQFNFRQKVTETELNEAIDAAETAQTTSAVDNGLMQNGDASHIPFASPDSGDFNALKGGINHGLKVSITGLNATVSAGDAYDQQGRRIATVTPLVVDLSATGDTAVGVGGTPIGGFATTVPSGQTRWITLLIYFDRALSDLRIDGNNAPVYFNEDESFHFRVKAGNATAGTAVKPSLDANTIVLGDFLRNDANAIATQEFNRRGDWIRMSATNPATVPPTDQSEDGTATDDAFIQGTPRDAIIKLRNMSSLATGNYVGHISQSAPVDRHAAKNIDFAAITTPWPDGTTPSLIARAGGGSATDGVQGAVNELITDLAAKTGTGGSSRIGSVAISGSPITLPATNVHDHESILLSGINDHINDTVAAHTATAISAATGGVRSSITVQGQLQDLDNNKAGLVMPYLFGNGNDGDVILNTPGTTTLTRDMYYNNLTLIGGAVIATSGHTVYVRDTLTVNGSDGSFFTEFTSTTGKNAINATSNVGTGGGTGFNSVLIGTSGAAGSLLGGNNGGAGGSNAVGNAGLNTVDGLGGNGGAGGQATGGNNGGAAGTVTSINGASNIGNILGSVMHPGYLFGVQISGGVPVARLVGIQGGAGGGGGGGNGTGGGGGGGAGGGVLIIFASKIVNQTGLEFLCVGGTGGNGFTGGGASGGGGGGGALFMSFKTITVAPAAGCVAGGLHGAGAGTTDGANGSPGNIYTIVQQLS